jgi:hypothetical protein
MLEFFLSTLLIFFVPAVVSTLTMSWRPVLAFIVNNFMFMLALTLVGAMASYVAARRLCDTSDVKDSLIRGSLTGFITTVCYNIVGYIPTLRVPFAVIGYVPGLKPWVDSFIMSFFYIISNLLLEVGWGPCSGVVPPAAPATTTTTATKA